jgi:CheY-like chemotaxis protein
MNLVANARDAIPAGGNITIRTELLSIDEQFIEAHGFGKKGNYAVLVVSDTGEGMDEKTRKKIFEPFFTTKGEGKGTGLGLSMVYGIIKQHGGLIHCYSEPRMGTTFKIYLPLLATAGEARVEKVSRPLAGESLRGNETILVAEDDEVMRALVKATLSEFGYTVITAVDGKDALERFLENRDSIRLVLCDVIMPRMNGGEVMDAVRKMMPGMRILFMSGYPADIIKQKGLLGDGAEMILKPLAPSELLKKVRGALDRNPREQAG